MYNGYTTLLATAWAEVMDGDNRRRTIRALCDPGSQASFISERTVQRLRLQRNKAAIDVAGVGESLGGRTNGVVKLKLRSRYNKHTQLELYAFVLIKICSHLPTFEIPDERINSWTYLNGLDLADPHFYRPGEVDLLLGAEAWSKIILDGIRRGGTSAPFAQETILGWVVSGPVDLNNCKSLMVTNNQAENLAGKYLQFDLTRFWELEESTTSQQLSDTDEACEKFYAETTRLDCNGRYIVRIPFLPNEPELGNSYRMAEQRFYRLERRFQNDTQLRESYTKFMTEYIELGHMKECSNVMYDQQDNYFIPHHAVTEKFRVVFNASALTTNGKSLNDTQYIGPTVQDKLADIILRFRRYPVAMVADITKMFRQVAVHLDDQKWQKIVWRNDPTKKLKTFQLTTVTYGTRSGPYLAVRTLIQAARDNSHIIKNQTQANEAVQNIEHNFYVDDFLTSTPTVSEAVDLACNITRILQQAHFPICKWRSTHVEVVQAVKSEARESGTLPLSIINEGLVLVLGLLWNSHRDTLSFEVTLGPTETYTKRTILSDISKLYDPTGLLAPIVVLGKILIQKLWLSGFGWDDIIPSELQRQWSTFRRNIFHVVELEIPRCIGSYAERNTVLHGFCDTSEQAYAAVIYMKTIDRQGEVTMHLLTSKTRVAPVKTVSIPRLELCGAQLLVRTMINVRKAMNMAEVEYQLWKDSTIVLAWLRQIPSKLKVYVANRVSYIQQNSDPSKWHHISGVLNPADCASRGMNVRELQEHNLWWNGPNFLFNSNDATTKPYPTVEEQQVIQSEVRLTTVVAFGKLQENLIFTRTRNGQQIDLFSRTNSLIKLQRIMVCILYGWRRKETVGRILYTVERLHYAMMKLQYLDQRRWFQREIAALKDEEDVHRGSPLWKLNPFLDREGILRIRGRLKRAELDENEKYPIILAKSSRLAALIVSEVHQKTLHGQIQLMLQILRKNYWVIGARVLIKSHINKCTVCCRHRGSTAQQRMGDLPFHRVNRQRPFQASGVDYCGPFTLKLGVKRSRTTTKTYAVIFVFMATKAVYIELAVDLSTEAFLNAFSRFSSRRGLCTHLYSDNGTNFHGADRRMQEDLRQWLSEHCQQQLAHRGTIWHFIPPGAPHQGGIWEAAVKSVKRHLLRVVGNAVMAYEQFYTLLIRVEACLNSRPIVALHDDPDEKLALTPGDFLIGGPIIALPEPDVTNLSMNRTKEWAVIRRWTQHIWKRWQDEYLHTLQQRNKWVTSEKNLNIDDVVLVKDENYPPTRWCLGRITELHPSSDGFVRVVTLRGYDVTGKRHYTMKRPVQKLCLLNSEDNSETNVSAGAGMLRIPTTNILAKR